MDTNITLLGIMVEHFESTSELNDILHEMRDKVLGRLGLPKVRSDLSVISIVLNASADEAQMLVERLSALPGVTVGMMCG